MDWLASAAAWLRERLGEFALLGALKPTIDGLPDWVLLAACVSIVATLVLAVVVLAAQMRSPPKRSEASPFAGAQDAVGAQKKGAAKPVGTSSKPARWTVSMEAKLRNAAPLDFDKVVALAQDAEFAAEGVTVRGIAAKAQSMGLGVVARHAPDAPDPVIVPEAESIVPPGPAIDQRRMPQTMNEDELHTFIRAAFSASYMIAAADGEITSEEMQAFMDALKQRLDVDMDPAELLESFEAALELEAEQHLERIAEAAVLSADLRRDILDIALSIAASDGDFDPNEIQCLPIVAAALDVDLSGDEEGESEDSDADPDDGGDDINPVASLPSNEGKGLPDLDPDQNPTRAAMLDATLHTFIRAAFSASFMIAAADGEITSEEMQAFMDALKQRLDVDMDPAELVKSFEAALELEAEQHLQRIADAAVLPADLRRDILDIALSIAASDGDFDPNEIQCLPIVAAALDVDLSGDEEEESDDSDADPNDGGEDIDPVASLPSNAGKGLPDLDPDQNPIIAATLDGNVDKLKRLMAEGHSATDIHTSGTDALILAVREGHLEIVDLLIGSGADPNRMNPQSGMTPIRMAVQELRSEIAGLLLERGADPDQPIDVPEAAINGVPLEILALHVRRGNGASAFEMMDLFLRSGADPKSKGPGLCFPLLALAVQKHRPQTLDLLLRAGVDPNATDEKTGLQVLPVLIGTATGEKDGKALHMLDSLLNAGLRNQHIQIEGASIPAVQFCAMQDDLPPGFLSRIAAGATKADVDLALWAACIEGVGANVQDLLGVGADVNLVVPWLDHDPTAVGDSPLNAAATRGHTECARLLIDAGADVNRNSPPAGGQFPLLMAAENGHQQIVSMLLGAGADISMINPENGTHALGGAVREGHSSIVKMLLDAGADPNIRSRGYGSPMIMFAAYRGDLGMIQSLISHGADVNQLGSENGSTALMAAANRGHSDVVEFLLRHGADATLISPVTGADALLAAVSGGHPESASLLLNAGADVHRAYSGTPLICIAAEKGEADLVRLLIAHGAKVDAKDSDGLTALQRAGINRHAEAEAVLIELGADPDTRLIRLSDTPAGQEIQEELLREVQLKGAEIAKLLMLDGLEEKEELKELDRSSGDRRFLEKARADALDEARRLGAEGADAEALAKAASDFVEKATSALDLSEEKVESVGQDGVDQRDTVHGDGTDPQREATAPSADLIGGDGLTRSASELIPQEELSGLIKSVERLPAVISFLKQDTTTGDEWNAVVRRRHDKLVGTYVEKTRRLSAADWKRFSPHYARALTLSANIRVVEDDYAGASGLLGQAVSIFSEMMASGDEGLITKHRPYFEHAERSAKVLDGARKLMDVVSGNGPFDREREGFSAYKAGDFATAIENYRAAAEAGLINSQYNLGEMYSLGEGVDKSWTEAERLWKLAAEGGHARAAFNLAIAYANGEGNLPENLDEAMRFARLAAAQGYPRAAGIVASLERRAREDVASVEPEPDSPPELQFMVPFLSALWLIMAADGEVVDEEVTMFARIMNGVVGSFGIDNISEDWISEALSALADHDDETHFSSIAESPFVQTLGYRTELVKAMFFLMAADGNSAPEETEVFDRICASFAVAGDVYQITDELSIHWTKGGISLH